jgi:thiol-disulfide isomerase/thioredoxin
LGEQSWGHDDGGGVLTRRRWLGLGLLVALQFALVALCNRLDEGRERAELPVRVERRSDPARDLEVEFPGGARHLIRARSGQFQLVHFWATWCPPCRSELPTLLDLARRERGRLRVWAVTTDHEWEPVRRFLDGRVPATVVRTSSDEATASYRVTGLPDSYLIDPSGRIRARFSGAQNWAAPEMRRILDELLSGS